MSHLRARTNGVLFAITVILAVIVFAIRFMAQDSHVPGQMKPVLAVMDVERQDPCWSDANAGPALGARVPVISGVAIDGQTGISTLGAGGERVLFLMPDPDICPDCHASARRPSWTCRPRGDGLPATRPSNISRPKAGSLNPFPPPGGFMWAGLYRGWSSGGSTVHRSGWPRRPRARPGIFNRLLINVNCWSGLT